MLDAIQLTRNFLKKIQFEWPSLTTTTDDYTLYVRPLTGRLLQAFALDWHYKDGRGNWLSARHPRLAPRGVQVFDAVGGYGANLLGHKNPQLQKYLLDQVPRASPAHTQGSIRMSSAKLAGKISAILQKETQEGPWITHFSNSGTEAVETAIKHALLSYHSRMQDETFQIQESYHLGLMKYRSLPAKKQAAFFRAFKRKLKSFLQAEKAQMKRTEWAHYLSLTAHQNFLGCWNELHQLHQSILNADPYLIAMEGGFHGKTLGALKVTAKKEYRSSFYVDEEHQLKCLLLSRNDLENTNKKLRSLSVSLLHFKFSESLEADFSIYRDSLVPVAGVILEPLQGEAGIYELDHGLIRHLRQWTQTNKVLLIYDEVQSGLYRTGLFACGHHSGAAADIYCFSKALGGGLVKIGATSILKKKYLSEFGLLHTSTFAEDDLSSKIGYRVLSMLTHKSSPLPKALQEAKKLEEQLRELQNQYPHLIHDVRGRGLMLAVEFQEAIKKKCFEFKFFADANMIGHLFASALLSHHHIRLAPTLSGPFTLRIEPSIHLNQKEVKFLLKGFKALVQALENMDMQYFFGHLYDKQKIVNTPGKIHPRTWAPFKKNLPLAVFLNHPIDHSELIKTMTSHVHVEKTALFHKLNLGQQVFSFDITHREVIYDQNGKAIELALMSLPLPSEEIMTLYRSQEKSLIVEKIQQAIMKAKDLRAHTVGLGQFTSIVTHNGLYLDPLSMSLTTGNAYTCFLAIEALIAEGKKKKVNFDQATIACLGAAGNIISVTSSILTDWCGTMVLIYHSTLEQSEKLRQSLRMILRDIKNSRAKGVCSFELKELLKKYPVESDRDLCSFMQLKEVQKRIRVENHLNSLPHAELVVTGANSAVPFLEANHFKQSAVVIDLAVPKNVKDCVLTQRPDLTYLLGGIAALPAHAKNKGLTASFFPLPVGQVFACMAETMTLTFSEKMGRLSLGSLRRRQVEEIGVMARSVGFSLAVMKERASF